MQGAKIDSNWRWNRQNSIRYSKGQKDILGKSLRFFNLIMGLVNDIEFVGIKAWLIKRK